MRLCHSVWTRPVLTLHNNPQEMIAINIWLYALSLAYVKRLENATLVLHTDTLGKKLFGFLPYDHIYVSLDDIRTPEHFWATGKIVTQSLEPAGSIHIDGDVFLKKPELASRLDFTGYDALVQNEEHINPFYTDHLDIFKTQCREVYELFKPERKVAAVNCGVVGLNDQQLKATYISEYLRTVEMCARNERFMHYIKNHQDFIPDLILEQKSLGALLKKDNCKTKYLLSDPGNLQQEAVSIGFTHLLGKSKYELIETVKQRLLETDPVLYEITNKKTQHIKPL